MSNKMDISALSYAHEGAVKLEKHLHFSDPALARSDRGRFESFSARGGRYNVYSVKKGDALCFMVLVHEREAALWTLPYRQIELGWDCLKIESGLFGIYSDADYPRIFRGDLRRTSFFKKAAQVAEHQLYKRSAVFRAPLFVSECDVYCRGGKNPYMFVVDFCQFPAIKREDIQEMLKNGCRDYTEPQPVAPPEFPTYAYYLTKTKVGLGTCPSGFISYHNYEKPKPHNNMLVRAKVMYRQELPAETLEYFELVKEF